MRILRRSLLPLLLWAFAMAPSARTEDMIQKMPKPIADARWMIERGQALEALAVLNPLVRQDSPLTEAQRGIAWNAIGLAYRSMDRLDEARHSLETAIHILSALPDQKAQTASTLNNLGGVEEAAGNLNGAKILRRKAMRLDQEAADHAGAALVASNMANLALNQHDLSAARKLDRQAFDEARLTTEIDTGNVSAMYSVKGAIARSSGDLNEAVAAYQQAIDLQARLCPSGCPKLGILYSLRAEANGMLKAYPQALADFQKSLSMLADGTQDYLQIELAYAQILRNSGSADGQRLEVKARTGLETLRGTQCGGCTISAESLR